jgi:hypothetical protein
MAFNADAVSTLFAALVSDAQQLGVFERVATHEPKNAPGNGFSCVLWLDTLKPYKSGLASTSGVVTFHARVYSNMLAEPQDDIDPGLLTASCALLAAYSDGFTLGGTVQAVDLLGAAGEPLSMQAGYITQDGKMFRAMEVVIPVIINDLWDQAA